LKHVHKNKREKLDRIWKAILVVKKLAKQKQKAIIYPSIIENFLPNVFVSMMQYDNIIDGISEKTIKYNNIFYQFQIKF
jgi:hypothetical protein